MKTIAEEWEAYRAACYPAGISGVQLKETRQAFMAGAMVAQQQITDCSKNPDEEAAAQAVGECMADVLRENSKAAAAARSQN